MRSDTLRTPVKLPLLVLTLLLLAAQAVVLRYTRWLAIEHAGVRGDTTLIMLASHRDLVKGILFGVLVMGVLVTRHLLKTSGHAALLQHQPKLLAWLAQWLFFTALVALLWWLPQAGTLHWLQASGLDAALWGAMGYLLFALLWLGLIGSSALLLAPGASWQDFIQTHRASMIGMLAGVLMYVASQVLLTHIEALWSNIFLSPTLQIATIFGKALGLSVVAQAGPTLFGTANFVVDIGPTCLGYQGVSIVLLVLLSYFYAQRQDLRFPQVLLILPASIALLLLLNALRIALLVSIGAHWSPDIAAMGFHATAGWVELILTIASALYLINRFHWFTPSPVAPARFAVDGPDFWLLPLVVLIATSFLTQLFTGSFYWAYPVHIVVTAVFLWRFRQHLPPLTSHSPGVALLAGLTVLVFWVLLIPSDPQDNNLFALNLFNAASGPGVAWLVLRLLGSTLVVPLVEELAFRGFLWRVVMARLGQHLSERKATWATLGITSLAFGLFHAHWHVAALTGVCYGLVYLRRKCLADAILAHAVTNLLIGLYAMVFGHWSYW